MIVQHIDVGANKNLLQGCLSHHGRALRDFSHAVCNLVQFVGFGRADVVPRFRLRWDDVGTVAAGGDDVMQSHLFRDVLPQEIYADVHQLHGVERRSTHMRRRRGVSWFAVKTESVALDAQSAALRRRVHRGGVEVKCRGQIRKCPGARHETLTAAALLCGAAVIAHGTRCVCGFQPVLNCDGSSHAAGAEQIVTAAMPGRAFL